MLKFLKWVKAAFWASVGALFLFTLTFASVYEYNSIPPWSEIVTSENISSQYFPAGKYSIQKSRLSAVKVKSSTLSLWSSSSTMTGTYFVANDKYYVLTVYHGILGPCWLAMVIHKDEYFECKEYTVMDEANDYVIIELKEPINNRQPIEIPQDLPHGNQWKKSYSILNNIIYTGYPNTIGPLTLKGDVIGYGHDEYLYIFSHAYGGASGSGVFTKEGKYRKGK